MQDTQLERFYLYIYDASKNSFMVGEEIQSTENQKIFFVVLDTDIFPREYELEFVIWLFP